MVNNNLPPESQPWVRAIQDGQTSTRGRINDIQGGIEVQQQAIADSLALLPDRIANLQARDAALAVPRAETYIQYTPDLADVPASAWVEVQHIPVSPPVGKTSLSLGVVSTGFVTTAGGAYLVSRFRIVINGVAFTPTVIGFDSTGVAIAQTNTTGLADIRIEFHTTDPGSITTVAAFPKQWRTFFLAVWS